MHKIFKPKLPNFELLGLENVCRICLQSTNNLLSLFNNEIDSLISEFLPEKLNKKPLQPHQICIECLKEAKAAYLFKKQCEYADKFIKYILDETENETFDYPKLIKIGKYELSCQNCLENFESEDGLKNHTCSLDFSSEKFVGADFLIGTEEYCKDNEINFSEFGFKSEDILNGFDDDSDSECKKNISVKLDIQIIDEEAIKYEEATEIVRSMTTESKTKNTRVKVKPNSNGEYECETCRKVFTRSTYYTRHQLVHSGGRKPYTCTMCSKSFSRSDHLKYHVNGSHANLRPFKCLTCDKAFTRNEHLKRHVLICSTERKKMRKDKIFPCGICARKFTSEKNVHNHIAFQHDKTREFTCKYCEQKIMGASEYKDHCKGHDFAPTKEFLCSECGASFTKLRYLTTHSKIHSGEKPYKCRYCDKAFSQPTYLYIHERSHTGEKNFHCSNCPKSFLTGSKLRVHMRVHTGERPYKCLYCPKSFSTAYKLRVHTRIHTGERPYKCSYCPKAFAQSNDLKAHHRRHTGELFYCDNCDVGFVQMYMLRQHKQQAHGINEPRGRSFFLENRKHQISEDETS